MWSSAVNHRFDFAYQEDAVTNAITATHTLPFYSPAPLLLPYAYQLLRLVLILSLSCLYLAVHTKPKPSCPRSIDGISRLFHLAFELGNGSEIIFFFFVCARLIIFNWNRQRGPGRNTERFIKHLYALIAFEKWLASILSSVQWGAFFLVLFCSVLWYPWAKKNWSASCQVNQWKISDVIVICFGRRERRRGRKIKMKGNSEWERRGLGRGNGLIDLLCANTERTEVHY